MDLSLRLHCFCPVTRRPLLWPHNSLLSNHFYSNLSLAEALRRSLANPPLHCYIPLCRHRDVKESPPPLGSGLRLTVKAQDTQTSHEMWDISCYNKTQDSSRLRLEFDCQWFSLNVVLKISINLANTAQIHICPRLWPCCWTETRREKLKQDTQSFNTDKN